MVYLITVVLLFADNSIDDDYIRQEENKLGHRLEKHLILKKRSL